MNRIKLYLLGSFFQRVNLFFRIYLREKKVVSFSLLLSIFLSSGLYCQRPKLRLQRFTVEQGLEQSSVLCILQDKKGFMWLGTEQGLNRFDGYNFLVYKFQHDDPNSLSNGYVRSIHEDPAGILWIGTDGGGLNRFDPKTRQFTHFLIDPESIDSLSNISNVIFEDHLGELWIGTAGGGLNKFDKEKEIFIHCPVNCTTPDRLSHNHINAIYEDNLGTLWIGTDGGLNQLDPGMNQIKPAALTDKKVLAIYQDNTGELWIGTDNGFYKYAYESGQFIHFQIPCDDKNAASANVIRSFYQDHLGTFWIGTDYGLHIFDRQENKYYSYYVDLNDPHSLAGNAIRDIYQDRSGALWVGTYGAGFNKLNRTEPSFNHYYSNPKNPDSFISQDVFAIYEDPVGVLWIGTYGEGLVGFNRQTDEFINYRNRPDDPNSLSDNRIWSIYGDQQGMLWIGTAEDGLNQLHPKTGKCIRYQHQSQNPNSLGNNTVSSIIVDPGEIVWIGTDGGLDRFDPKRNIFVHYKTKPKNPNTLVHNNVYILHEDRSGMLWLGTKGGLSIFDPKSETFTSYPINRLDPNSLIHHPIMSICQDRQGGIWLGTTGGLYKFDREKETVVVYTKKDGLPNDVINGILEDDRGNLWLSTNKGLSKFSPGTGQFKNYSAADGLQSLEFCAGAYYKNRRGELFFGGINGFNGFFPDSVKDNPYIPPVVITDFKIFNQSVPVGKKFNGRVILEKSIISVEAITLSHKLHTFSFEFAGLNYIDSEENQYAYMMEGIDKSWNYVGTRRFVTYANLAPGDYIFRVKASNNHGVWNEEGIALKIKILPPFWVTWWFRLALVILVLILVFAAYRLRTRLILRRNRELEDVVARRTVALRESGEKYRTVVERAHSGIAIVQDNLVVFNNVRFSKLLGYDESDMINRPMIQLVIPGKQPDIKDTLMLSGNEKTSSGNFETVVVHKDGRRIPVEVNYGTITYKKRPALLMFFHDIRMQKLLEEERMKTAKLESTRILTGGIAHDFNNLLAVIIGNIELALADITPGDSIYKSLKDVEKSSMKAVDLIQQFITLAKDDVPLKKTEFIQGIIRDAVQSALQGSGVTCHYHLHDNLWPVDCNAQHINQVIENIVINARQAMSNNGVLEVTAENEELAAEQIPNKRAGKYVCIIIKDNGVGIPPRDLSKIFDPYFSTRENVTQKGLGLGLAVVHSIISRHKGIINVTSEVGVGTTVRICLPASKDILY
jgi:PAS domain S-box-containing protein